MIRSNLLSLHRDTGELLWLELVLHGCGPSTEDMTEREGIKTFSSGCSCIPFNAHSFRLSITEKSLKKGLNSEKQVVWFSIGVGRNDWICCSLIHTPLLLHQQLSAEELCIYLFVKGVQQGLLHGPGQVLQKNNSGYKWIWPWLRTWGQYQHTDAAGRRQRKAPEMKAAERKYF